MIDELQDVVQIAGSPVFSERSASTSTWHPKLTGYRLIVIVLTVGCGLSKAILSYKGKTITPITLEWVFGVVIFLVLYWLGLYENHDPRVMPWLFETDYASYLWRFIALIFSCRTPSYRTDERSVVMLIKKRHPPITGYRILLSATTIGFGLVKSILAYRGLSTAPTTVDWVFAVVVTASLYWLGLYESSSTEVLPSLFETDYAPAILTILESS